MPVCVKHLIFAQDSLDPIRYAKLVCNVSHFAAQEFLSSEEIRHVCDVFLMEVSKQRYPVHPNTRHHLSEGRLFPLHRGRKLLHAADGPVRSRPELLLQTRERVSCTARNARCFDIHGGKHADLLDNVCCEDCCCDLLRLCAKFTRLYGAALHLLRAADISAVPQAQLTESLCAAASDALIEDGAQRLCIAGLPAARLLKRKNGTCGKSCLTRTLHAPRADEVVDLRFFCKDAARLFGQGESAARLFVEGCDDLCEHGRGIAGDAGAREEGGLEPDADARFLRSARSGNVLRLRECDLALPVLGVL